MKIFKKIGFVFDCIQVYEEISKYINEKHVDDKIKDAVDTIKSGIDKLGDIFVDVKFLKDKFFEIFGKKGK